MTRTPNGDYEIPEDYPALEYICTYCLEDVDPQHCYVDSDSGIPIVWHPECRLK